MRVLWLLSVVSCAAFVTGASDNTPSLLIANATIGIVIDRQYLSDEYAKIKQSIEKYFIYAKREILKHGGINVQYFSWTSINVKRDFTAILSIASCADTWNLYKAAVDENILFMSISEPDCPRLPSSLAVTVPLLQNGEEFPQLLLDLRSANAYDWKSAIVLYDGTLERDMVTRVVTSLTGHASTGLGGAAAPMSVSLLRLDNHTTEFQQRKAVSELLARLPVKQLGRNFLAIVSLQYVNSIMEVAKNLGLVNPASQWLYVVSDTNADKSDISPLSNLIGEGENVAFVYNTTTGASKCASGLQCHSEELLEAFARSLESAILDEVSVSNQVSEEEWEAIRPTKSERRDFLLQGIKAHLTSAGVCNNCTTWQLQAGDSWGRTFVQNYTQPLLLAGYWRPSDGVSFTDELFPHVKHKFRGLQLPLVTYHDPPWQILTVNESGHVTQHQGLVFDIVDELSRRLNFTYSVQLSRLAAAPDAEGGNGTESVDAAAASPLAADDVVQQVRGGRLLLGACGLTVSSQRKQLINFTTPISIQLHTFLVARPRHLSRALLFISPFTYDTWLCLALAVVTMGPVLYLVNRLSPVYEYRGTSVKGLTNIQNCVWYMYGALLQQGGMYLPEVDSARLIVGTWWLVVLVVVTTYCGNLVAFLTFPKIDIPIRTVSDLIEHGDTVTWGITKGTFLHQYLQESEEQRYRTLYQGLILHEEMTPEIISRVRERTHVYIAWKMKIAYLMKKNFLETGSCDFAFGEEEFLDEKIAMIVAQNSPYLPIINEEITRLHQVGLIEKWLRDYLPKKDRCWKVGDVTEVNNHTVNIDDMQGCFFVLFLGSAFSAILILMEKYLHRRKLKKVKSVIKPFVS